jgi:hypothetical protein
MSVLVLSRRQAHNVPIVYTRFTSRLPATEIMDAVMRTVHHHSPHAAPARLQLDAAQGLVRITVEGMYCVVQLFAEVNTPSAAVSGSRTACRAAVTAVAADASTCTVVQMRRLSGDSLVFRKYYACVYDSFFAPVAAASAAAPAESAAACPLFVCPPPPLAALSSEEHDAVHGVPAAAAVAVSGERQDDGGRHADDHTDRAPKKPRHVPPQ